MTKRPGGLCIPYSVRETPHKGRGIFVEEAIPAGTVLWRHVLGEYAVYDEVGFRALLKGMSEDDAVYELHHAFGVPEFPGYMIRVFDDGVLINHAKDATVRMNDVPEGYRAPDVASVAEVEQALLSERFWLISTRDLQPGDELVHDYDVDVKDPAYFDELAQQYGVTWDYMEEGE